MTALGPALRRLMLLGLALGAGGASSCALSFPDYDVEGDGTGGSSSSTSGGGGFGGGPVLVADGQPCSADAECLNGNCRPNNTEPGSICCAVACTAMGVETCGTNGNCDASGTDCALYPAGAECGETTCTAGETSTDRCRAGACEATHPEPCAGGFVCATDGVSCAMACSGDEDCVNPSGETFGAVCLAGDCTDRPVGAPCESDADCESGACAGRCCAAPCNDDDPACGVTACDAEGACVYPSSDTPCGTDTACSEGALESQYCDGAGTCGRARTLLCPGHLACASPTSCYATCGSNDATGDTRCPYGYWCDGATCHRGGYDESTPCFRDGQCLSGACGPAGKCTDAGCDFDQDGFERQGSKCDGDDCDDNDLRARPDQEDFFTSPRSDGSFDFNCSKAVELAHPPTCGGCAGHELLVPAGEAGCGVTGALQSCALFFGCWKMPTGATATQTCH